MKLDYKQIEEILKEKGKSKPGRPFGNSEQLTAKDLSEKYGVCINYIHQIWSGNRRNKGR